MLVKKEQINNKQSGTNQEVDSMKDNSTNYRKKELEISNIETTNDKITGRAGLSLFVTYLHRINVFPHLDKSFGSIRKNQKGLEVCELFKQALCFFVDGTSRHVSGFDQIKQDAGYAGAIETEPENMASTDQMDRFFKAFSWRRVYLFRYLLQTLFIWRLKVKQPNVIELGIDTQVLDNNDAHRRHGVKPTYKKVKGFQPLQMNWGRLIADAIFRGGNKHSNHGDAVLKMIRHMVKKIRNEYRNDVPIIIRMDSGFFDKKIFRLCEELNIGYICGGKLYKDIKNLADMTENDVWTPYRNGKKQYWEYVEFGSRRGTWKRFRRAIYCRRINNGKQLLLPGFGPDTIIVTNLGQGQAIDEMLKKAGAEIYLRTDSIVACYHERGNDELAYRALKDFGHEKLPFKRFIPNTAWYYTMLMGHFLMETFKEDAVCPVVPIGAYASTIRRRVIDVAGKIVTHGKKIILKVSTACLMSLHIREIFHRCKWAPVIY